MHIFIFSLLHRLSVRARLIWGMSAVLWMCSGGFLLAQSLPTFIVNERLWGSLSRIEQVDILERFPAIEIASAESVGVVISAQVGNRSSVGSTSGAALGGALAQSAYIDRSLGSSNRYSAVTQLGAGLVGAALGASLDSPAIVRYLISYSIQGADGEIKEVRVMSGEEFVKAPGQCVYLSTVGPAPKSACFSTKQQLIEQLIESKRVEDGQKKGLVDKVVSCNVPNVGLMTLGESSCAKLKGVSE